MSEFKRITATILAGGLGTRLRSVVNDRPKVLADVGGKPFLSYLLDHLLTSGVQSVVLCTGFMGGQIHREFGDKYGGLSISYSHESSPLGTGGALRLALPLIDSESALIMNGDSLCDANLVDFCDWHLSRGAHASLLLVGMLDTKRYGKVAVDDEGRVLRFDEKDEEAAPGWINAGIYLIRRCLIEKIPESGSISLERELFPKWIGHELYGYRTKARFIDIGTPEALAIAPEFFSHGRQDK